MKRKSPLIAAPARTGLYLPDRKRLERSGWHRQKGEALTVELGVFLFHPRKEEQQRERRRFCLPFPCQTRRQSPGPRRRRPAIAQHPFLSLLSLSLTSSSLLAHFAFVFHHPIPLSPPCHHAFLRHHCRRCSRPCPLRFRPDVHHHPGLVRPLFLPSLPAPLHLRRQLTLSPLSSQRLHLPDRFRRPHLLHHNRHGLPLRQHDVPQRCRDVHGGVLRRNDACGGYCVWRAGAFRSSSLRTTTQS